MTEIFYTHAEELIMWATAAKNALTVAVLRYALMALPAFVLCWLLLGRAFPGRRIQSQAIPTRQILREFVLSISSCIIFALIDVAVLYFSFTGVLRAQLYAPIPGLPAFATTVVVLLVLHDAYFYWAHRLMHWGPVYRLTHATHHSIKSPSPFAAFAFHPFEAVIQYAFVPIVALVYPIHLMPLYVFGLIMTAMNVYAHLGYEFLPAGFVRNGAGRFLLTATHHNLHHSAPPQDLAFYFNYWDRWMGTLNPRYEETFEQVTSKSEAS